MTTVIFTVVKTSDVPIYYGDFIILSCDNISVLFFLFFCIFCFHLIAVSSLFSLHLIFKSNTIVRYIISCDSWCIIMHLTLLGGHIPRKALSTRPFKWMYLLLHSNIMAYFLNSIKIRLQAQNSSLCLLLMSVQNEKAFKATKNHQTCV